MSVRREAAGRTAVSDYRCFLSAELFASRGPAVITGLVPQGKLPPHSLSRYGNPAVYAISRLLCCLRSDKETTNANVTVFCRLALAW